jgi:hypothetical protein
MPHHAHSIDRWDDATGSNLYEHLAGVNDLLLAQATFPKWGGALIISATKLPARGWMYPTPRKWPRWPCWWGLFSDFGGTRPMPRASVPNPTPSSQERAPEGQGSGTFTRG